MSKMNAMEKKITSWLIQSIYFLLEGSSLLPMEKVVPKLYSTSIPEKVEVFAWYFGRSIWLPL